MIGAVPCGDHYWPQDIQAHSRQSQKTQGSKVLLQPVGGTPLTPFSDSCQGVVCLSIQMSRKRDRTTGLNTLKYSILSHLNMTINGAPFHFVNVELACDTTVTPFCDVPPK